MMFENEIIIVVHKRGQNQGIVISLNIKSKIHIIAIFIAIPKRPKVIIRSGRATTLITGFTKKLIRPSVIPKSSIICHCKVNGIPKKFESESTLIFISGINNTAIQMPNEAAIICERTFFINRMIPD